jgi:hypothetical protein
MYGGDVIQKPLTEMLFLEHLQSQLYARTSQTKFLRDSNSEGHERWFDLKM